MGQTPSKKNSHHIRRSGRKAWISPKPEYQQWENNAVLQLQAQKNQRKPYVDYPLKGRLNLSCVIYRRHQYQPDLSNLIQSVEDALERAGIIENDKYIESLDGSRRVLGCTFGNERAEIELSVKEES
jgi:Holliday junction resolvase RusA-like endonuclease